MVGVRFNIEGQLPPELRIVFRESGRGESPYLNVNNEGEFVALFEDDRVAYKPSAPPPNPSEVDGLQFMIATNASGPSPFDFCITDLEAIVGEAPDTSGVPSWVREPGPGKQNDLVGVNLAVAEFGSDRRAEFGTDYTYPTTEEVDYFMGKGMNVFRVPFGWERIQPTLMGELDTQNIVALSEFVTYATDAGATVVLDPHNYARYDGELIGSEAVPNAAFADFWSRIATVFKDNQFVAYGLMNEPHSLGDNGTESWLISANVAISAIRDTGAK